MKQEALKTLMQRMPEKLAQMKFNEINFLVGRDPKPKRIFNLELEILRDKSEYYQYDMFLVLISDNGTITWYNIASASNLSSDSAPEKTEIFDLLASQANRKEITNFIIITTSLALRSDDYPFFGSKELHFFNTPKTWVKKF